MKYLSALSGAARFVEPIRTEPSATEARMAARACGALGLVGGPPPARRPRALAVACGVFAGVVGLKLLPGADGHGLGFLFVLPIGMISLLLGATAGAVVALAALAVVAAAGGPTGTGFELVGYLIRAIVFGSGIALGVLARGAAAQAVAPARSGAPARRPGSQAGPLNGSGHPTPEPPDGLTNREVEVLESIAWGHTNREIAEQLCLSVRTIESHRRNIQVKLDLSTRAELVRYARDRQLIRA